MYSVALSSADHLFLVANSPRQPDTTSGRRRVNTYVVAAWPPRLSRVVGICLSLLDVTAPRCRGRWTVTFAQQNSSQSKYRMRSSVWRKRLGGSPAAPRSFKKRGGICAAVVSRPDPPLVIPCFCFLQSCIHSTTYCPRDTSII